MRGSPSRAPSPPTPPPKGEGSTPLSPGERGDGGVREGSRLNIWRELALLAVMVMEVSWGVAWLRALAPAVRLANPLPVFLACWAIVYGAHLLARLGNALRLLNALRRGSLLVYLAASFIVLKPVALAGRDAAAVDAFLNRPLSDISEIGALLPAEVFVAVMALLLVQRGASLARNWGGRDTIFTSLQWGLGLFAVYGIYATLVHLATPGWLLYTFVAGALLAMVTGRVAALAWLRGGVRSPFDARWMAGILAAVTAAVGLAALFGSLLGRQTERLNQLVGLVFYGIVALMVAPFAYLLKIGNPAIEAARQLIPTPTPGPVLPAWELADAQPTAIAEMKNAADAGNSLLAMLQPFLLALVILVLLVIIFRTLGAWQTRPEALPDAEHESLLEGQSLWNLLLDALRGRVRKTTEDLAGLTRLRRAERLRAAARIRNIYADLMTLCAELGQPRPDAFTPLEYLPYAVEMFPAQGHELEQITQAYLRVRYGELPETRQEVQAVEAAWQQVSQQGAAYKKELAAAAKK